MSQTSFFFLSWKYWFQHPSKGAAREKKSLFSCYCFPWITFCFGRPRPVERFLLPWGTFNVKCLEILGSVSFFVKLYCDAKNSQKLRRALQWVLAAGDLGQSAGMIPCFWRDLLDWEAEGRGLLKDWKARKDEGEKTRGEVGVGPGEGGERWSEEKEQRAEIWEPVNDADPMTADKSASSQNPKNHFFMDLAVCSEAIVNREYHYRLQRWRLSFSGTRQSSPDLEKQPQTQSRAEQTNHVFTLGRIMYTTPGKVQQRVQFLD